MLTTIERVLLLQDLDLFQFASTEHLAQFAAVCEEAEIPARQTVFRQGERASKLYLLVEGKVRLESKDSQNRIAEKTALEFWSFLAEGNFKVTAQTLENCTFLAISFGEVLDLLTAEAEFCWAILRYLSRTYGRLQVL